MQEDILLVLLDVHLANVTAFTSELEDTLQQCSTEPECQEFQGAASQVQRLMQLNAATRSYAPLSILGTMASVLQPLQLAQLFMGCFPHMMTLQALRPMLAKLRQERESEQEPARGGPKFKAYSA